MKVFDTYDLKEIIANADGSYKENLKEIESFLDDDSYSNEALANTLYKLNEFVAKTNSKKKRINFALREYISELCEEALSSCDGIYEDLCRNQGNIESIHEHYQRKDI